MIYLAKALFKLRNAQNLVAINEASKPASKWINEDFNSLKTVLLEFISRF